MSDLLTVPAAALRLGVTEARIRYYIKRDELLPVGGKSKGTRTLLRAEDVDALAGRGDGRRRRTEQYRNADHGDFVTRAQAAELLGITEYTIKNYILDGRLTRTNPEHRNGVVALYRRSDVEALRVCLRGQWLASRVARRAEIAATGMRECVGPCGRVLPLESFGRAAKPHAIEGREARCRECLAAVKRAHRHRNPEAYRAMRQRWEAKHPETTRAHNRKSYHRHAEQRRAKSRAWRQTWRPVLLAIEDGKTSPITKRAGFSIAKGPNGVRAARLDRPLERGEVALVRYERFAFAEKWVILLPPLPSAEAEVVTAFCRKREQKREQKREATMPETIAPAPAATPAAAPTVNLCVVVDGWMAHLYPSEVAGFRIDVHRPLTADTTRLALTRSRFDLVATFSAISYAAVHDLVDGDRIAALKAVSELRRCVDASRKEAACGDKAA